MTTRKPDPAPTDEAVAEAKTEPAAGTVVRLDDPNGDGDPVFALACGDGYVVRLPAASKWELPTYPIG